MMHHSQRGARLDDTEDSEDESEDDAGGDDEAADDDQPSESDDDDDQPGAEEAAAGGARALPDDGAAARPNLGRAHAARYADLNADSYYTGTNLFYSETGLDGHDRYIIMNKA